MLSHIPVAFAKFAVLLSIANSVLCKFHNVVPLQTIGKKITNKTIGIVINGSVKSSHIKTTIKRPSLMHIVSAAIFSKNALCFSERNNFPLLAQSCAVLWQLIRIVCRVHQLVIIESVRNDERTSNQGFTLIVGNDIAKIIHAHKVCTHIVSLSNRGGFSVNNYKVHLIGSFQCLNLTIVSIIDSGCNVKHFFKKFLKIFLAL